MPLIVQAKDYARWLDRENAEIADILAPYPAEGMIAYPVSRRVNSPTNDDAKRVSRELAERESAKQPANMRTSGRRPALV